MNGRLERPERSASQLGFINCSGREMMEKNWICIEVAVAANIADDLAAEVADAFQAGVEITKTGIRFYLDEDCSSKDWKDRLRRVLDDAGRMFQPEEPMTISCAPFLEENWAERWKVHFKPLKVGKRFLVTPTWEKANPEAGDLVIWMDPGRAFGTGHHETTRLCLEWLEEWAEGLEEPGSRSLLDVGTGSGILSMAAALLGAGHITGVDNDPEAIEVALENTALNKLDSKVTLQVSTAEEVSGSYDVVISNIQMLPLIDMADALIGRLKPEGRLVLSGILVEQKDAVRGAFEAKGLKVLGSRTEGEWCLLEFTQSGKG